MSHVQVVFDVSLRFNVHDQGAAADLAAKLARIAVGFAGEPGVLGSTIDVDTYEQVCHHEHEHDGVEP